MSRTMRPDEPQAVAVTDAIRSGNTEALRRLLDDHPGLAAVRLQQDSDGGGEERISRTLLHVATDWPGHFPNVGATIRALVDAGADVNARNTPGTETPLHWAASSDDVDAIDALAERGADLDAPGAVIAGGTPLDDAVGFGQWHAARRLAELGAQAALWHAAALGYMDRIEDHFAGTTLPALHPWGASDPSPPDELTVAFWCACHGGQRPAAEYLLERGADINWVSVWDGLTPLDAASREGADDLIAWLRRRGAKTAQQMTSQAREDESRA